MSTMAPLGDSQSKKQITLDLGSHSNHSSFHLFFAGAMPSNHGSIVKASRGFWTHRCVRWFCWSPKHTDPQKFLRFFVSVFSAANPHMKWNKIIYVDQVAEAIIRIIYVKSVSYLDTQK